VPKKSKPAKRQPRAAKALRQDLQNSQDEIHSVHSVDSVKNPHLLAAAHFELREDGIIQTYPQMTQINADEKIKSAPVGAAGQSWSLHPIPLLSACLNRKQPAPKWIDSLAARAYQRHIHEDRSVLDRVRRRRLVHTLPFAGR
jgi:hypothetical protein